MNSAITMVCGLSFETYMYICSIKQNEFEHFLSQAQLFVLKYLRTFTQHFLSYLMRKFQKSEIVFSIILTCLHAINCNDQMFLLFYSSMKSSMSMILSLIQAISATGNSNAMQCNEYTPFKRD